MFVSLVEIMCLARHRGSQQLQQHKEHEQPLHRFAVPLPRWGRITPAPWPVR